MSAQLRKFRLELMQGIPGQHNAYGHTAYKRGVAAVTRPVTKTRLPALGYLRRSEIDSWLSRW